MNIFKVVKEVLKGRSRRLIGFHGSDEMDTLITLTSLNRRITRAALLRIIVRGWIKKGKINLDTAISDIAEKTYYQWSANYRIVGDEKGSLCKFKFALVQDLASRKVSSDIVNKIIEKFDEVRKTSEAQH